MTDLKSFVPILLHMEGIEKLNISPEEAFVLSRVNGKSSLDEIASILSLSIEKVHESLQNFIKEGFVELQSTIVKDVPVIEKKYKPSLLDQLDLEDRDPLMSLLPRQKRIEIRDQWQCMQKENPRERFVLKPEDMQADIKKRYFELVKQFHPDRYFGKAHGLYQTYLNEIFEKLTLTLNELTSAHKKVEQKIFPKTGQEYRVQNKIDSLLSMGQKDENAGALKSALSFYQMAQSLDPSHEEVKKALRRVLDKLNR